MGAETINITLKVWRQSDAVFENGLANHFKQVVFQPLTDEAAAVSTSVVVIDAGRLRFHGSPAQLTARAQGHVWISPQPPVSARRTWRLPDGSHRCIGDPPPGAQLVPPTMEDGYLMLVSDPAAAAAA